jgi:hypothetical protein
MTDAADSGSVFLFDDLDCLTDPEDPGVSPLNVYRGDQASDSFSKLPSDCGGVGKSERLGCGRSSQGEYLFDEDS